jgi:hypothetical protein
MIILKVIPIFETQERYDATFRITLKFEVSWAKRLGFP